ncbi:MAG: ASCH domain-containing protein [Planctomycetota bacterium]|jgi:hypothetical protein
MVALSIRQPYVELVLRGVKTVEYRSRPTRKRERVYLYASTIPADDPAAWASVDAAPGELDAGHLVGTVEIVNCTGNDGAYQWHLRDPQRLATPLKPVNKPQPVFFHPF